MTWKQQKNPDPLKKRRLQANAKVKKQVKAANIRAKYGPTRKPAPVVIKNLETGEVLNVTDQRTFESAGQRAAAFARRNRRR